MRVSYYVASSVDGFLAPENGSLDWLTPFSSLGEDYGYADFYSRIDALVVGARTYEQMLDLGEWPHRDRPTIVMSSRTLPVTGTDITVSASDAAAVLDLLANQGLQRVWLMGGGALASSYAQAGLIDEYVISYLPVLLGTGIGLLAGRGGHTGLRLTDYRAYAHGVVQCTYEPEAT